MDTINEGATSVLSLTFRDEDGLLVVPDNCQYRIDDVLSERVVRDDTVFIPTSSSEDLVIQSSENNILDRSKSEETRKVTIICQYSNFTRQLTDQFKYKITNLKFLDTSLNVSDSIALVESFTVTIG